MSGKSACRNNPFTITCGGVRVCVCVRACVCMFLSIPVEFEKLDLASLQSIQQFADSFKKRNLPLNILVNNGR